MEIEIIIGHDLPDLYIEMMNTRPHTEDINRIVSRILNLDPYKIILFGSQAVGTSTEESDIDILVILDSENISKTYEEKMRNTLSVRNNIYEINKNVPIDLIVFTKAEYEILEKEMTSFAKGISNTGKILYEKAS